MPPCGRLQYRLRLEHGVGCIGKHELLRQQFADSFNIPCARRFTELLCRMLAHLMNLWYE